MLFWLKFFRKHSRHCDYRTESYELFGVFTLHSYCKCGWRSEDHGQTALGRFEALAEFSQHLNHESDLARAKLSV